MSELTANLNETPKLPPVLSDIVAGARAEFVIPTGIAPDDCQQVRRALLALHQKYGVEILLIKDIEPHQ